MPSMAYSRRPARSRTAACRAAGAGCPGEAGAERGGSGCCSPPTTRRGIGLLRAASCIDTCVSVRPCEGIPGREWPPDASGYDPHNRPTATRQEHSGRPGRTVGRSLEKTSHRVRRLFTRPACNPARKAKGPVRPKSYGPLQRPTGLGDLSGQDQAVILVTWPAPTVRPPSRMANFRPSSMATGWMSSTFISVLSPGMTISVPSGRVTTPVTSVVRK